MSFNSVTFFVFLAVVLTLHRALPWRAGRVMMVLASYVFYGFAEPVYCLLLLTSTLVDFVVAQLIHRTDRSRPRKALLALSLLTNLGLLGFFKYGDFAVDNLNAILGLFGAGSFDQFGWLLPIGISFYTFQTLSYTFDVYYGKIEPTRDFVGFALYVAFFPQLMAGPIERASALLPQLARKQPFEARGFELGFQRVLWGLVKKVVFADRLAVFVDAVYQRPETADGLALLLASGCFALQIYLDFSGYTDIAIGVARMMGIRLRENFNWPMLARNPVDFWSRWHISLSSWFRDYVFTALVGRKGRPRLPRKLANLVIVLALMGLWHGAGWNFLMLGVVAGLAVAGYEAVYLVLGRPRHKPLFGDRPWSTPLAVVLTSVHALVLAVIFRSPTVSHALDVFTGILTNPWAWEPHYYLYGAMLLGVWTACVVRGIYMTHRPQLSLPAPVRAAFWCAMVLAILYGAVDTTQQYIYFQF
jgi:D-alanyl-lipoteichoic acid acyltransferase DltB (MBOAT superfamily)